VISGIRIQNAANESEYPESVFPISNPLPVSDINCEAGGWLFQNDVECNLGRSPTVIAISIDSHWLLLYDYLYLHITF
jgi:hypothetical protein